MGIGEWLTYFKHESSGSAITTSYIDGIGVGWVSGHAEDLARELDGRAMLVARFLGFARAFGKRVTVNGIRAIDQLRVDKQMLFI